MLIEPDPVRVLVAFAQHEVDYVLTGEAARVVRGIGAADRCVVSVVPNPDAANLTRLAAALRSLEARLILGWSRETGRLQVQAGHLAPALFRKWPFLQLLTPAGRVEVQLRPPDAVGGYRHLAHRAAELHVARVPLLVAAVSDLQQGAGPVSSATSSRVVVSGELKHQRQTRADAVRTRSLRPESRTVTPVVVHPPTTPPATAANWRR